MTTVRLTSTGIDIDRASMCALCSAGHNNHCSCDQDCHHPACRGKRDKGRSPSSRVHR